MSGGRDPNYDALAKTVGAKPDPEPPKLDFPTKSELRLQGYLNGVPISDDEVRKLWPSRKMTLAESLTHMMVEYIDGARRLPTSIQIDRESLLPIFEKRLARYISADQIAQIISEDATLQNGNLNVGYLAVKIVETIEGKRNSNT